MQIRIDINMQSEAWIGKIFKIFSIYPNSIEDMAENWISLGCGLSMENQNGHGPLIHILFQYFSKYYFFGMFENP